MGDEILEMSVKSRNFVIFMVRKSYRSACSHPFLVCMLLFLVFLYRSSPFVFSLLVSASPVLVCTAVLLGTLLSFGQPNIPEIDRDEKFNNEIGSLRTGITRDTVVVEESEGSSVERVTHRSGAITEHSNDDVNLVANTSRELDSGDKLDYCSPLIVEGLLEIKSEKEEVQGGRLLCVTENNRESKTDDEELDFEMDKSPAESFDSERVNVDSLDSPPGSPWKHMEEEEEQVEEEDADEAEEDAESDQAESSSPDASMADIIPMLDELHPLLDDDAPQPIHMSHDGSDAASEHSDETDDSESVSDDNIEKHEDLDGADEETDDSESVSDDNIEKHEDLNGADEEADEEQFTKEGQTKAAIIWTVEDQKNLMDLGSSELERNQRLESLIARRRARKTLSMMPERNLIDLESNDLPFSIAPISTSRNNPFDLAHDSYDSMGLPPIPGSAPSIFLARRNPFDIPYDSSEEKPDLMADSFQQEFSPIPPKETLFRRRESFNVGPSIFGPNRHDKQDIRLRPFFVPERSYLEESSYSPFQRQSSGLSDSKASSVPETESVVSTGDIEENNLVEDNDTQNAGSVNFVPEIELRSQAGDLETNNSYGEDISDALETSMMTENSNHGDEDFTQEADVIVKMEDVSEQVGHGSQSSSEEEDSSSEGDEIEERGLGDDNGELLVKNNNHKVEPLRIDERHVTNPVELHDTTTPSSSVLSEEGEKIFPQRDADGMPMSVEGRDFNEVAQMSEQHFQQGSNKESGSVVNTQHKEPIYDSSPTSIRKNASLSSVLSELNVESDMGFPPVLSMGPVSFAEREFGGQKLEGTSDTNETPGVSSIISLSDGNQSDSKMAVDMDKIGFPLRDEESDSTIAPAVSESVVHHVSIDSQSLLGTSIDGNSMNEMGRHGSMDKQISSSVDLNVDGARHPDVKLLGCSSEDRNSGYPSEHLHSQYHEQVPHVTSRDGQTIVEHSPDKKSGFQTEIGIAPTSSGENNDAVISLESDERRIFSNGQHYLEEKYFPDFGEELVFLDRTMDVAPSRDQHGVQEPLVMPEEISEVQDLETVPANTNVPTSPESINASSEAYENRAVECYSDYEFEDDSRYHATGVRDVQDIDYVEDLSEEIGEELLSELDTVGDFSVKTLDSGMPVFETHVVASHEADSPAPHMPGSVVCDDISAKLQQSGLTSKEDLKSVSETQASGTGSSTKHADVYGGDSKESEVHSSDDLKTPEKPILGKENETDLVESKAVENSNLVVDFEMPVIEAQSLEDMEAILKKAETSEKAEVMIDSLEEPHEDQDSRKYATSEMPMIEAQSAEDIQAIFKKTESTLENVLDDSGKPHEDQKSSMDASSEMPEAKSSSDLERDVLNSSDMTHDEGVTLETTSSNTPVLEAQGLVDIHSEVLTETKMQLPNLVEAKAANVIQECDLAPKLDLDKNEEGTVNDEQSIVKESIVQGGINSADDANSDAKVTVPESSVLSRDEGEGEKSILTFGKDLESNEAGLSNGQQLSPKESVHQESTNSDVNTDAKVAVPESSVVSHDEDNGNKSDKSSLSSDSSSSDSDKESK